MSEYGVAAGSEVDFVLEATEKSVVKQLSELLQSRDLTCDELGLLYCYKYGVSTNQALKTIGVDMKLADFVKEQKTFVVEGKKVSVGRQGHQGDVGQQDRVPVPVCPSEGRGQPQEAAHALFPHAECLQRIARQALRHQRARQR